MNTLTPQEQDRLNAALRPGETVLWQGRGLPAAPQQKGGLLARLFGKPTSAEPVLYAITAKRVLAVPPQGEPREWFLMLGLIQGVDEGSGGSGNIVFDYEEIDGQKEPRGLIGVAQVAQVRNLLNDAIDAAYNASPWSV